ncbi:hypothetical protein A2851_02105 [Candidatus Kaiserbacteria bacterium RIFCSPHIGHO2_01_FULL_53_29]|uniref:Uncharacterized protein n=1 Tax=Candidatus Kaiserbacteria bacterium RIFCSPHIGHO2_01_FULL_53_29 TaxID=1798480 RepID=A0A1F6CWW9_9BACT|nr:MAG: hypothetical protein A2851_02105 [Candidatus Kaiserbacteria bacterium RIFCSPHIGHO2_01_FULL_53_29]
MVFVTAIFFISLVGIGLLFGLKYWEMRRERILAPSMRSELDRRAVQLKELMAAARVDLAKLPPIAVRLSRLAIHEAALGFAALARFAEGQAHRLADLVSHKHRFERRETRSEFLKKVAEHKSGGMESETEETSTELDESAR